MRTILNIIALTVIVLVIVTGHTTLSAQDAFRCSPAVAAFTTAGGSAFISVVGKNSDGITSVRVTKDGQVQDKFKAQFNRAAAGAAFVAVNLAVLPGLPVSDAYRLEVLSGKQWTAVPCQISVRAPLGSTAAMRADKNLKATRIVDLASAKKNMQPAQTFVQTVLSGRYGGMTSAEAERVTRLRNALQKAAGPGPEVNDWFPKEKGAMGGTLVLIGKNLDSVRNVQLNGTTLQIISRNKGFNFENIVVALPAQATTGRLTYTRSFGAGGVSSVSNTIEQNYAVIDQYSAAWPRPRATLLSVNGNAMYNDRPHANMQYSFYVVMEYIPGNVVRDYDILSQESFRASREVVGGVNLISGTATQRDASGNLFINGNVMIVNAVGYLTMLGGPNTENVATNIHISVKSYDNARSAQNNVITSEYICPVQYVNPQEYTIEDTYTLKDMFRFTNFYSFGTTDGTSETFGGGSPVEVGLINRSGDLAFRIASGPGGTEGSWVAHPFAMPEGWQIQDLEWVEKHTFPADQYPKAKSQMTSTQLDNAAIFRTVLNLPYDFCRDFSSAYMRPYLIGGLLQPPYNNNNEYHLMDNALRHEKLSYRYDLSRQKNCMPYIGESWMLPRGATDNRQNVKGTFITLKAQSTLFNDHRVVVYLKSVKLYGLRGARATDWIGSVTKHQPDDAFQGPTPFGPVLPEYFFVQDGAQ